MEFDIELLPGTDLKRVTDFMLEHKSKGRRVGCTFNGIRIDSDNIRVISTKKVVTLKNKNDNLRDIISFLDECNKHDIEGYFEYNSSVIISSKNISIDEDSIKVAIDSSDGGNIPEIDDFLSECEALGIVGMCNYKGAIVVSNDQNTEKNLKEPNKKV